VTTAKQKLCLILLGNFDYFDEFPQGIVMDLRKDVRCKKCHEQIFDQSHHNAFFG